MSRPLPLTEHPAELADEFLALAKRCRAYAPTLAPGRLNMADALNAAEHAGRAAEAMRRLTRSLDAAPPPTPRSDE